MKKQELKGVWLTKQTHSLLKQKAARECISIHEFLEKLINESINAKI